MTHSFKVGQLVRLKGRLGIFEVVHQLAAAEGSVRLYSVRGAAGDRIVGEHEIVRA